MEDRICKASNKKVKLSEQEILDCDHTSEGCKGGSMNRVLAWGKRKGYITEECYTRANDAEEYKNECTSETLAENECR